MLKITFLDETIDIDHSLSNVHDTEQDFDSDCDDILENEEDLELNDQFGTSTSESLQPNQTGFNLVPTPELSVIEWRHS